MDRRQVCEVRAVILHVHGVQQLGDVVGRGHGQGGARVHGHLAPRRVGGIVAELQRAPAHVDVAHRHEPVALVLRLLLADGQPVHALAGRQALGPPAPEGYLAVLVRLQVPEEDPEDGLDRGAGLQAVHEAEVRARREPRETKAEDAVKGELDEGKARLLRDAEEVGGGADLGLRDAVAEADVVADVLARELARAVRDGLGVPVGLASRQGRVVVVRELHRGGGGLRAEAVVPGADLVRALHRRQHDVAGPRVEDDVEELRRAAHGDLAVVLRDVELPSHTMGVGRGAFGQRYRGFNDADKLLQRQREGAARVGGGRAQDEGMGGNRAEAGRLHR
mmetsp:Transcript_25218/g.79522  ORF Transcript_25218/g.79522 Transcript_25218/m.79522 type:complete len:335 (-) Transcript_25218:52-1056(-)